VLTVNSINLILLIILIINRTSHTNPSFGKPLRTLPGNYPVFAFLPVVRRISERNAVVVACSKLRLEDAKEIMKTLCYVGRDAAKDPS
jgi:hypothetical protein